LKPALPLTGRLHRLNASGAIWSNGRQENGQTDGASAAHPEKAGAVARSAVQFWTFTMSNSKSLKSPRTRAVLRRAFARIVRSLDARRRECVRTRSIHVGLMAFGIYGPIGSLLPVGGGWWPAAGQSGSLDPCRASASNDWNPVSSARTMLRPLGRSDDQAFGALSAELYGPKRRIGFLICRTMFFRQGGAYVRLCAENQGRRMISRRIGNGLLVCTRGVNIHSRA